MNWGGKVLLLHTGACNTVHKLYSKALSAALLLGEVKWRFKAALTPAAAAAAQLRYCCYVYMLHRSCCC